MVTRKPKSETVDHPLAHLIPDEIRLEAYASRKIGGVVDLDIMEAALEECHNVAVFGPTGCAKTSMVYAFGAKHQLPVVSVPCNGAADPDFLFGGWNPTPDGHFRLAPGDVYYVAKYGGIIYLDEVNFMPSKIASLLHGPMDTRRTMTIPAFRGCEDQLDVLGNSIESVFRLHPRCMIVAAWNPGYSGTYSLNEAFFNRFNHKIPFDYQRDVEEELVESTALLDLAEKLRAAARAGQISTPVSTNSIMELEENSVHPKLGFAYAVENFINMFQTDERAAVREIVRNHLDAIKADIAGIIGSEVEEGDMDE